MKTFTTTLLALLAALAGPADVDAADAPPLQRLALCQDSWLDWRDDPARMARFADGLQTQFERSTADGAFTPKAPTSVLGAPLAQAYPQSVGMGVGFSLMLNAGHAQLRARIEQQLGKPMACSTSEGVRACELQLGAKKTAVLMTGQNGQAQSSLVGCYYFYQQ